MPAETNNRFLRACRREIVDATPVWFMRQAGRFLPEYRAIRERHTLLQICDQPDLAAEVTLQPLRILGVDAAILFADILLPLVPMGIRLEFASGEGPVIHNPIRSAADVEALRPVEPRESLAKILTTVRLVRRELKAGQALIGFAGAPFTLASYLIEGGPSRNYLLTKQMMYAEPQTWHALMTRLSRLVADYLSAQVVAGAQAVQLFDSWVGVLPPEDYQEYVLPYSRAIFEALAPLHVPRIHFGTGTASLLPAMQQAGGEVMGIDWQTPLEDAWRRLGEDAILQGNLDPAALLAPRDELTRRVDHVLAQASGRRGHIFNLGHGILPQTPVDNVRWVVDYVHQQTTQAAL